MNDAARQPQDTAARAAGLLLLLTAAATLVSVVARLSADADEPTLAKSLAAIAQNKVLYGVGGAARFVSGLTLIGAAWFLSRTWAIRAWRGARLAPVLLVLSGICTAVSGACAIALAATLEAPAEALPAGVLMAVDPSAETIAYFRWVAGKVGFTLAGLALVVAAARQWKAGRTARPIAPASAAIGVAMLFIWLDAAAITHRISGPAFFIWLVVAGLTLWAPYKKGRSADSTSSTVTSPS